MTNQVVDGILRSHFAHFNEALVEGWHDVFHKVVPERVALGL